MVSRKLRADAADNRQRILTGARTAFAADGLDLPMRELARRLDLGVATVYRHFPSREELVSTVLTAEVAQCAEDLRSALADPDPARALRETIVRFGDRQVMNRGLNEALLGRHAAGAAFADQRREHAAGFARLVQRAHDDQALRARVTLEDARAALTAIASFRALPADRAGQAVRRLTDLLLTALFEEPSPA